MKVRPETRSMFLAAAWLAMVQIPTECELLAHLEMSLRSSA